MTWQHLEHQSHQWRQQLFLKDTDLPASTVWQDVLLNGLTIDEAADNWGLSIEAVEEAVTYCEANRELIDSEAQKQVDRIVEHGSCVTFY